jgi:hypothetical protein
MNGRVDVGLIKEKNIQQFVYGNNMANLFSLRDKIPAKQCVSLQEPLKGIWTSDAISDRFFSQGNVDYIQTQIQERIYQKTQGKYTIDKQDNTSLFVIMRGFFLQYATNNNDHIEQQLYKLLDKDTHITEFSEDTHLGYRGPIMFWKEIKYLDKVYIYES